MLGLNKASQGYLLMVYIFITCICTILVYIWIKSDNNFKVLLAY